MFSFHLEVLAILDFKFKAFHGINFETSKLIFFFNSPKLRVSGFRQVILGNVLEVFPAQEILECLRFLLL